MILRSPQEMKFMFVWLPNLNGTQPCSRFYSVAEGAEDKLTTRGPVFIYFSI